jgi:hypothetical protein
MRLGIAAPPIVGGVIGTPEEADAQRVGKIARIGMIWGRSRLQNVTNASVCCAAPFPSAVA